MEDSCKEEEEKGRRTRRGVFDLEAQFAFYRAQHRHPVNAAAHELLVWPIVFANLLMLHFLRLPAIDAALALALAYAAIGVAVDRRAGSFAALLYLGGWASSRALAPHLGFSLAWKVALVTQLFCWPWQFVGHAVFEKRGPSVSDLPEVILMEPFLIFLQIIHKHFAYEPYPGFVDNVDKMIRAELEESRESKQKKVT